MLNLVSAIQEVNEVIWEKQSRFHKEIAGYEACLKKLKEMNEACFICNGKGKILRTRACAEDDRPDPNDPDDWEICPYCKGTGLDKKG